MTEGGFDILFKGTVLTIVTITSRLNDALVESAFGIYYKTAIVLSFNPNSTVVDLIIELTMKSLPFITLLLYYFKDWKGIHKGIDEYIVKYFKKKKPKK